MLNVILGINNRNRCILEATVHYEMLKDVNEHSRNRTTPSRKAIHQKESSKNVM